MEAVINTSPLDRRTSIKNPLSYLIVLIIISFGVQSFQRNDIWRMELSLWYNVNMNSPLKVRTYVALGVAYGELGLLDGAVKNLEKAVRVEPDNAAYRMDLGAAYVLAERTDKAVFELERSLQLKESHKTRYNLAKALEDKEEVDEAIKHLEAAIRIEVNYFEAYSYLGLLYRKQGRTKDAIAIYRLVLERDKDFMMARYNLARIYMEEELWQEAVMEFEAILKRDPADKGARDELNRAIEAAGEG